jgi:2-(1,2-epoxy-1,2-dihydrophenyl)acetyl-CoA isomerase
MIHSACPANEVAATADALVQRLASGPTVALGLAKKLLASAATTNLVQAMADEAMGLELAARTTDFREGLAAFVERRDPNFRGA